MPLSVKMKNDFQVVFCSFNQFHATGLFLYPLRDKWQEIY